VDGRTRSAVRARVVPVCLEPDHLPPAPTEKWRLAAAEAAEEAAAVRSLAISMA
jgi:hypothetical protein